MGQQLRVVVALIIWTALLAFNTVNAFQSLRILSMSHGLKTNYSDPEIVGGSKNRCYRTCVPGDVRTCKYRFTLHEYTTMSTVCGDCPYNKSDCFNPGCSTAGGDIRSIVVINHMLPGPSIQVCEGDTIQVHVKNALLSESSSIHWHGMHQINTPYMDGVPYVTQCPILPGNSFTYNFTASPSGTHLYHSHSGYQETDGMYGTLIVRSVDDPLADYYDYDLPEHVMIIWHWFNASSSSILNTGLHTGNSRGGYSLTINGLAATVEYEQDGVVYKTPRAQFNVTRGYRYRLRIIGNMAVYCPVQVSFDNHTFMVIAVDGASVEPVEVESLMINAGERYDVVVTANETVQNYWIRYRGTGNCLSVSSQAILHYEEAEDADPAGSTDYDDAKRSGVLLNPLAELLTDYSNSTLIRISELNSTASNRQNVSGTPDHVIYLPFSFNTYSDFIVPGPYPQFNNVSFEYPPIPFLTQKAELTSDMYCTNYNRSAQDCSGGYCTCPYIYQVASSILVEIVIIDESPLTIDVDHPLHIHGQYLQVVAMVPGKETITLEEIKALNEAGLIDKNTENAPLRDIIATPAHGYIVARFRTNNPGYWILHCHVAAHMEEGMAVVIQSGVNSEMIDRPSGFPTCGNFDITSHRGGLRHQAPPRKTDRDAQSRKLKLPKKKSRNNLKRNEISNHRDVRGQFQKYPRIQSFHN